MSQSEDDPTSTVLAENQAPEAVVEPESPGYQEGLAIFINEVSGILPAEIQTQFAATVVKVFVEQFHGSIADSTAWAIFYNNVGSEMSVISRQASAELFGRAYDTERPHRLGTYQPKYAENFINDFTLFINSTQNPTEEQKDWIQDRKSTLVDVQECMEAQMNKSIFMEGWRQAPKKEEDQDQLAQWDPEALAKVKEYSALSQKAKETLEGPLKFV